ncbi:hypothetical protein [Sphingomonas sp. R86521]|uniref:hypothetical protein n=1 Tax=Sphingomonas sp. R86521 TaxID=3093860 RepID=UPI0036D43585
MFAIVLLAMTMPVTLTCTIDDRWRPATMMLRMDEVHGVVRYSWPATAPAVKSRALFTRDTVMFDGFTLDRASLAIVRDGDALTGMLGAQPRAAKGRCRTSRGARPR